MAYAIVESGVVVNVIEADEDYAQSIGAIPVGNAGIGWRWDGLNFKEPIPQAPEVPSTITRAQGKAALIQWGLWDGVTAYVDAMPIGLEKALAEVALNDTIEWRRDSAFLNKAASELGLDADALDGLFTQAAEINL